MICPHCQRELAGRPAVCPHCGTRLSGRFETLPLHVALLFPSLFAVLLVSGGMLLPALNLARETARRTACITNLKYLAVHLAEYAGENAGHLPSESALRQIADNNADVFRCPGVRTSVGTDDYLYFGADYTESDDHSLPLLCDKPDNHRHFINVLFLDGHVEWIRCPAGSGRTPEELADLLKLGEEQRARVLKAIENAGRPATTEEKP